MRLIEKLSLSTDKLSFSNYCIFGLTYALPIVDHIMPFSSRLYAVFIPKVRQLLYHQIQPLRQTYDTNGQIGPEEHGY